MGTSDLKVDCRLHSQASSQKGVPAHEKNLKLCSQCSGRQSWQSCQGHNDRVGDMEFCLPACVRMKMCTLHFYLLHGLERTEYSLDFLNLELFWCDLTPAHLLWSTHRRFNPRNSHVNKLVAAVLVVYKTVWTSYLGAIATYRQRQSQGFIFFKNEDWL